MESIPVDAPAPPADKPEVIEREGDLVLDGSETLRLEGVNYTLRGDIYVTGNATLRIAASWLNLGLDEPAFIHVNDSARLELWDVNIRTVQGVRVRLRDEAAAYLDTATIWSEYEVSNLTYYSSGFGLSQQATLRAEDSTIGYIRLGDNSSCNLNRCVVGALEPVSQAASQLERTRVHDLHLYFIGGEATITGNIHGPHSKWSPQVDLQSEGCLTRLDATETNFTNPPWIHAFNTDLSLIDTTLTVVDAARTESIYVEDSDLLALSLMEGITEGWIRDSTVDYLNCIQGEYVMILEYSVFERITVMDDYFLGLHLYNCTVGSLIKSPSALTRIPRMMNLDASNIGELTVYPNTDTILKCKNTTIGGLTIPVGNPHDQGSLQIKGNLTFRESAQLTQSRRDGHTTITRDYPLEASREGAPQPGLTLELRRGEETIWRGETDENGEATLTLTYLDIFQVDTTQPGGPTTTDYSNMTQTLTLSAPSHPETLLQVGLLSDTPILIQIEPPATQTGLTFTAAILGVTGLLALLLLKRSP